MIAQIETWFQALNLSNTGKLPCCDGVVLGLHHSDAIPMPTSGLRRPVKSSSGASIQWLQQQPQASANFGYCRSSERFAYFVLGVTLKAPQEFPVSLRAVRLQMYKQPPKSGFCVTFSFVMLAGPLLAEDPKTDECDQRLQSFNTTIKHVELLLEDSGSSFLSADIVRDPDSDCTAIWVLELLTRNDEVEILVLDAQTLEILKELPEYFLAILKRPSFTPDSQDLRPVRIRVQGTPERDLLEGEWSDDVSFGGQGRDTFLLTPGRDVILDFDPAQDVLNLTNFVFSDFGFPTLTTLPKVLSAARTAERDGQTGTEIDIDGDAGDWSVFLPDVDTGQLTKANVIFPSNDEPSDAPVFQAERQVELSDGSLVIIPGHKLDEDPIDPFLAKGSSEALALIRRLFFFDEFQQDEK